MIYVCTIDSFIWKPAEKLLMMEKQRTNLNAWIGAETSVQRTVQSVCICLLAEDGLPNGIIAQNLKSSRPTVIQWRKRFEERGPVRLEDDAPHGLSSCVLPTKKVKAIVDEATLNTTPPNATYWSTRAMAKAMEVSNTTVSRIWDMYGLQPCRVGMLNITKDKRFVGKFKDLMEKYLNPPDEVVILCLDKKSQIQVLDQTQPSLPMKKGRCRPISHN